jgi:hypothetical protein
MIHFIYQLKSHGWALATISDGQTEVTFPASYLCDALRDFVDALASLSTASSAECMWQEEPGQVRWSFRRAGDRVTVHVSWADENHGTFSADDDLLHFGEEVNKELRNLLNEWGVKGYLDKWGHPFPQEAHNKLEQALIHERKQRQIPRQSG